MKSNLLLLAYKFPPYAGVGGFRWSKLCKYLAEQGYRVHVVTLKWQQRGPHTMINDIQHPNLYIHRIPSGYPHNFRHWSLPNRYLNALKNRILLYPLHRLLFFDDEAQRWGNYLIPFCETLIEAENIDTMIATGAPFQTNRWAAVLKKRNSNIRLIQDFQDEWADNIYRSWPSKVLSQVREWQKFSVEEADLVVAVTKGLLTLYLRETDQKNGIVVSNGYDSHTLPDAKMNSEKTLYTFTHIGNLRVGREEPLRKFLEAVRTVHRQIPKLRVNLVGDAGPDTETLFADLIQNDVLHIQGYVTQEKAFEIVKGSTYALQFNARIYPYLVSTKIYEYGALQVPTFSCNYGGEIHDLIVEHDLGYSINVDSEDIASYLLRLYELPKQSFRYEVDSFSYSNLARRYSTLIQG